MSPNDFAALLDRGAAALPGEVKRAEEETLREALDSAIRHSSGTLSSAALAAMGHPFSKRRGAPLLDPGEINVQTDTFRQAWETELPVEQGGDIESALYNTDPKAPELEQGTPRVFARPIDQKIIQDVSVSRIDRLDQALDRALR